MDLRSVKRWLDCGVLMLAVAACGGDDAGGSESAADEGSGDASAASEESTASAGESSMTQSGSAEGSSSDGESGSEGGSDGSSGSEGGSGSDTGTAACGDAGCGPDMVCVHPCCGGAPPACQPLPEDGMCPSGSMPVDASQCTLGCNGVTCCLPTGPCEAPDPYCVAATELVCGGDPVVEDQCSVDDCYGIRDGDDLNCMCA